jgi:hypothetical protein
MAEPEGSGVSYNKPAEMWGLMLNWLGGAVVDDDPGLGLIADLTRVEYTVRRRRKSILDKMAKPDKRAV